MNYFPVESRQSGRSGVRCIMLGSGLGRTAAGLVLLASAGWDGGWRWTANGGRRQLGGWIFPSSASPEIVELRYENIDKFC